MTLKELLATGKQGWMDATDFDHELGRALGGNRVYPDREDLIKHHPCLRPGDGCICEAKRVLVFDAETVERLLNAENPFAVTDAAMPSDL